MNDPDCIFCKIVLGQIPCATVLETEDLLAFLDIAPVNLGHVLVIPKAHYPGLWDLPLDLAQAMLGAIQKVGLGLKAAVKAEGLNLGMNNGRAAGQLVAHAHWHVIPRFAADGLKSWPQKSYSDQGEMQRLAESIAMEIL
jgi:histidine triad (HIT) family protein